MPCANNSFHRIAYAPMEPTPSGRLIGALSHQIRPKAIATVQDINVKRDVAQNHQFKYLLVFETVVIRGHVTPGQIRQSRDPSPCNDSRDRRAQHIFRGWRPGKFPVANEGSELKHRYSNFSLGLHEKPRPSVFIQWWGRTPCFYEEIINRLCSVV